MRHRRSLLVSCSFVAATLFAAPSAHAQDTQCDPGEREVRSLVFSGNHAFTHDQLAVRVSTTPSSFARKVFRIFGTKRCLNSGTLAEDVKALGRFYRATGYLRVKVDTAVTPMGETAVKVVFNITEGQPVRIAQASVGGLDSVRERNQVLRGLYLRVGVPFDKLKIQADYDSIVDRLRNVGYPKADLLRNERTDTVAYLAYVEPTVITGPKAKFGGADIDVATLDGHSRQIPDRIVRQLIGIDSGDVYRAREIDEAQRNLYRTAAYRHVEVAADSVQPQGDTLVRLHVALVEDLMNQLDTETGYATLDCFRLRAVYTNKNFLQAARRFELTGQLTKIGVGAPLGTDFVRNNLCRQIKSDPFSATTNYFVGATVRQPALFGTNAVPALSVYSERRGEYLAWLRTTAIGADLSLTKNLGLRPTPIRLAYTFEFGRTEAQDALLCAVFKRCDQESRELLTQNRPLGVASVLASRVRTDNDLVPTRGTIFRAEARTSATFLGSNDSLTFNKGVLDGIWYHPLAFHSVFVVRLRAGAVYGGVKETGGARLPPPQERLYAGGATSVRGFQQNELGDAVYISSGKIQTLYCGASTGPACSTTPPADTVAGDTAYFFTSREGAEFSRIVPVGGNAMFVANIEYRLRSPFLSDLLQYVLFTDAGQVWTRGQRNQGLGFNSLKWTPGVGLRLLSPLGPIQVNVGYNKWPRPNGPLFFDAPIESATGWAPLYCVSPVSTPGDPNAVRNEALPAIYQPVKVRGNVIGLRYQQVTSTCPSTFTPPTSSGFLRKLTFTFSIGPDF